MVWFIENNISKRLLIVKSNLEPASSFSKIDKRFVNIRF